MAIPRSPNSTIEAFPLVIRNLVAQRFTRAFAYGGSTLVIIPYLSGLDHVGPSKVGIFMAATLWGDALLSLVFTKFAERLGKRNVLSVGSVSMAISGVIFAWGGLKLDTQPAIDPQSAWALMLLAGVFGVINPSGTEVGPFKAVEEALLAESSTDHDLPRIYAWYTLSGSLGSAIGLLTFGTLVDLMEKMPVKGKTKDGTASLAAKPRGQPAAMCNAYRVCFLIYAVVGALNATLAISMRQGAERGHPDRTDVQTVDSPLPDEVTQEHDEHDNEHTTLLQRHRESTSQELLSQAASVHVPENAPGSISDPSGAVVTIEDQRHRFSSSIGYLYVLFALDALGSGLSAHSWMAFYLQKEFFLSSSDLGKLYFSTSMISTCSHLFAPGLAARLGLVRAMIATHLPCGILLAVLPLAHGRPHLAIGSLAIRACLQSMDQAPRQALLAKLVQPRDRAAVLGMINVIKTMSYSLGPWLAGFMASKDQLGLCVSLAGIIKVLYDLLLLPLI